MIIAVDFDGTIVEHCYPRIGREIPFAFATLRKLQSEGHRLILWSVREGKLLDEAVDFCRRHGVEFYAVNANFPEEKIAEYPSAPCRKLRADLYIDDCNVGKLPDWGTIISWSVVVAVMPDIYGNWKEKGKALFGNV